MKNLKKLITSPAATIALFVLAAVLLLVSTIGGIRAAFQAISEIYSGQMQMHCIGVAQAMRIPDRSAGEITLKIPLINGMNLLWFFWVRSRTMRSTTLNS